VWSRVVIHGFPGCPESLVTKIDEQRRRCKKGESAEHTDSLFISAHIFQRYTINPPRITGGSVKRVALLLYVDIFADYKLKGIGREVILAKEPKEMRMKSGIFDVLLSMRNLAPSPGIRNVGPPTRSGLKV
jgi:hypothetical protein